jgi:O-methyltransferase
MQRMNNLFISMISSLLKSGDREAFFSFIQNSEISLSFKEKIGIAKKLFIISNEVDCPHTHEEILSYIKSILLLSSKIKGCIVEAGSYKGGSTAKFSLAAKFAGRKLIVFDSFQGIPEHSEPHRINIYGKPVTFSKGEYCGSLKEVKANIFKYGHLEVCEFIEGWFQDTMPGFTEPIAAIYIDADLASSVSTCLKYLYPLLSKGGVLYCQDGHLPLVIDVFNNEFFWINEVGYFKPIIEGLGHKKLIRIVKNTDVRRLGDKDL